MKVYYGGDILPMTSELDSPEAVVTSEGKIVFVGKKDEAMAFAGEQCEKVDLLGKTLMPAFIDAHGHISQMMQFLDACSLAEADNVADIQRIIREYIEANHIDESGIVLATRYDHNFLDEERHITGLELDAVSDKVPIFAMHTSGHIGVANHALLKLSGVSDTEPDPEGGKFGRNEDGTLNGYIEEVSALMRIMQPLFQRISVNPQTALMEVQKRYLKHGITTCQDGAAIPDGVMGFAQAAKAGMLTMDVVAYIMTDAYEEAKESLGEFYEEDYVGHFRIGGAKIILDGSPQGKSAWLSQPYEGEVSYAGYPSLPTETVEKACEEAVRNGYQLLAHCNGDAASEQFLDSYEKAIKTVGKKEDLRPVMIHCQIVRDDQLDRMVVLEMVPSIFIGHTYYWGDVHLKNLGEKRGSRVSPTKSALDRGLIYNFHQDPPVTEPDMLHSVWCAVNRITRKGVKIGEEQCIGVYDALKAVTINAAYAYHEEQKKGSIEVGKVADLVILDENPLKVDSMKIKDIAVVSTIFRGNEVYSK